MFKRLGERVLWRRVGDFLETYKPLLIGVTGSTGKTIAREAIALALGDKHRVRVPSRGVSGTADVALATLGIDRLGHKVSWYHMLSRSLIQELATKEPETIILELPVQRPGQLDFLSQQLPFQIMVVTNVGTTHTDLFDSKDMVAHELTSSVVGLPKQAVAVLNGDDPLVADMASKTKAHVITIGENEGVAVQWKHLRRLPDLSLAMELKIKGRSYEMHMPNIIARHHVSKVTLAVAVAMQFDMPLDQVIHRLQRFTPPPGRLRKLTGRRGAVLLDDTYTAAPEATTAAIKTLSIFKERRRIAILGDMQGLGRQSQAAHTAIGKVAGEQAHIVIAVGEEMRRAGTAAMKAGADVHHFNQADDVGKWLLDFMQSNDAILIAGSRGMHMEKVVRRLLAHPERDAAQIIA